MLLPQSLLQCLWGRASSLRPLAWSEHPLASPPTLPRLGLLLSLPPILGNALLSATLFDSSFQGLRDSVQQVLKLSVVVVTG